MLSYWKYLEGKAELEEPSLPPPKIPHPLKEGPNWLASIQLSFSSFSPSFSGSSTISSQ